MNRRSRIKLLSHVVYCFILLLFYVLQTTPGLFVINEVKPALIITVAMAIAVNKGEFVGGVYGIIAGIMMDTAGSGLFGYYSIMLGIICVIVGLLAKNLMQENIISFILYIFIATFILSGLQFVFTYGIWKLESVEKLFFQKVIGYTIYTTVVSPVSYFIIKRISIAFKNSMQKSIRKSV